MVRAGVLLPLEKERGKQDRGGEPKSLTPSLVFCVFDGCVDLSISFEIQISKRTTKFLNVLIQGVGSMNVCYIDISFRNNFKIFENWFFKNSPTTPRAGNSGPGLFPGPRRAWTSPGWQGGDAPLPDCVPESPLMHSSHIRPGVTCLVTWPHRPPVSRLH